MEENSPYVPKPSSSGPSRGCLRGIRNGSADYDCLIYEFAEVDKDSWSRGTKLITTKLSTSL